MIAAVIGVVGVAAGALLLRPVPTAVVASTPQASTTAVAALTATPTSNPTPAPALRVDGVARVVPSEGLGVWASPKVKGAKALSPSIPAGRVVFLTRTRHNDGVDWWEVQPDWPDVGPVLPFGWVRATDDDGHPTLAPFAPDCPSASGTVDPRAIARIHTMGALVCFGNREITLEGDLVCTSGVRDGGAGGVSWMNSYWWCVIDDALGVYGAPIDALAVGSPPDAARGRYRATGHFDDPEARRCHMLSIGVSLSAPGDPEPDAVNWCRQDFVVTELTKIE